MAMDLNGQHVLVMGLGRFGGGVGVTQYLVQQGAHVCVTDTLDETALAKSLQQLAHLPSDAVTYQLGAHREQDFTQADLVVVNPAVNPQNNAYVQAAMQAGVAITSEIRLLVSQLPNRSRIVGITGTAGKSTTAAMLYHCLQQLLTQDEHANARAWVGGNIGGSLLGELSNIRQEDWVVLELSSFMLEGLQRDAWSPGVAVLTNFSANHVDWHGSVAHYHACKQAIFDFQQPTDIAIVGPSDDQPFQTHTAKTIRCDQPPLPQEAFELLLPGKHNQHNALFVWHVLKQIGFAPEAIREAMRDFAGLVHRMQCVVEHNGLLFYNDSKSTTPQATERAIASFTQDTPTPRAVHLIVGGYDKQTDLTHLAHFARKQCKAIYTIGQTGQAIAHAAETFTGGEAALAEVVACETLEVAIREAIRRAKSEEVILLSPACASWDQFENYEQRGNVFTQLVLKYTTELVR